MQGFKALHLVPHFCRSKHVFTSATALKHCLLDNATVSSYQYTGAYKPCLAINYSYTIIRILPPPPLPGRRSASLWTRTSRRRATAPRPLPWRSAFPCAQMLLEWKRQARSSRWNSAHRRPETGRRSAGSRPSGSSDRGGTMISLSLSAGGRTWKPSVYPFQDFLQFLSPLQRASPSPFW